MSARPDVAPVPAAPDLVAIDRACRALIAAIFDRAIEDTRGRGGADEVAPARSWLESDAVGVGSFTWYCGLVGADVERARLFVRRRLEAQRPRRGRNRGLARMGAAPTE